MWRLAVLPTTLYTATFSLLTYPLILRFSTHFFGDNGDALTNYWNIWWVNKAITELGQSPWSTSFLHYPYGTSLLAHTLNPHNGFIGVFLLKFLSMNEVYNTLVVFAFAVGGVTTFFLAYYLTGGYWSSLIAGFIFTFSNYHFAHAQGHLDLTSLEWIPLFVLSFYVLVTRPSAKVALCSALVLFLVLMCNYYYFLYCVLSGLCVLGWYGWRKRDAWFLFGRAYRTAFLTFAVAALATSGPLILSLLVLNIRDPLEGGHPATNFSLDLLAPFIPGGHWRFASWTEWYWSRLPGNIHESSVHMGLSVVVLLVYVWKRRRVLHCESMSLWYVMLLTFFVMSLGPSLHVWGSVVVDIGMPYVLLEKVIPPMRFSGVPIRMVVICILSASVISAFGFRDLFDRSTRTRWLAAVLLVLMTFEYLPKAVPSTQIEVPEVFGTLRLLPGNEGVIDLTVEGRRFGENLSLYYQTVHEKPIALGRISRRTTSVVQKDAEVSRLIQGRQFGRLCREYRFRYLAARPDVRLQKLGHKAMTLFDSETVRLYDLGPRGECNPKLDSVTR